MSSTVCSSWIIEVSTVCASWIIELSSTPLPANVEASGPPVPAISSCFLMSYYSLPVCSTSCKGISMHQHGLVTQGLTGLPGDASQAFLPLTGSLQPGGLGSLFDLYSQSEENAARRELQQGSSYVDNLLPNAWGTIRNGGGPSLDPGLPDWTSHVSMTAVS